VTTIDLTKIPEGQSESEWKKAMSPYDGKTARFVGYFSAGHSPIKDDPAALCLLRGKFIYADHARLDLAAVEPSDAVAVRFGPSIPMPRIGPDDLQPFAVTGTFRVGDVSPRAGVPRAWGAVQCERLEELHGVPVGPRVTIPARQVESVKIISPGEWSEYTDESGARGYRVREGPVQGREYLEVVVNDPVEGEIRIYVIRPGGYYTKSADQLRIVPDPSSK
jgi:hypothetical protein